MVILNKICFIIIIFLSSEIFTSYELPVIEIFLESICPDCMDFIQGPFKNFIDNQSYKDLAIVKFYPFGNAKESWNEETQLWDFTCQHKDIECVGNIIETCALSKLTEEQGFK